MQLQGHVRVFGGVFAGAGDVDLIEGNLLRALSTDICVVNCFDAEVLFDRRIHVMPDHDAVEHIGLEHRVVLMAGERNPVIRENVAVELQVVAQFRPRRILEQRFQRGQHAAGVELRRHAGIVVRQRHVGGLSRGHGE